MQPRSEIEACGCRLWGNELPIFQVVTGNTSQKKPRRTLISLAGTFCETLISLALDVGKRVNWGYPTV